jgi:plasmid maintenance system killer protein
MLELEDEVQRLLQENNKLRKTVNNSQNFEQLYSSKQKEFEELRDQKKKLLSEMTNQKSDREKSGF